eukprot:TRINITY_DN12666_c0_g2_i1.p1 TRINITY_DN12666_c0_g2~~TRINITY_DN12666_c0_g2_i1.p1  ORF type:complete len:734 (+),score=136.30 TRINITY_DN12666_c0_g2_i1:104-2305(+)
MESRDEDSSDIAAWPSDGPAATPLDAYVGESAARGGVPGSFSVGEGPSEIQSPVRDPPPDDPPSSENLSGRSHPVAGCQSDECPAAAERFSQEDPDAAAGGAAGSEDSDIESGLRRAREQAADLRLALCHAAGLSPAERPGFLRVYFCDPANGFGSTLREEEDAEGPRRASARAVGNGGGADWALDVAITPSDLCGDAPVLPHQLLPHRHISRPKSRRAQRRGRAAAGATSSDDSSGGHPGWDLPPRPVSRRGRVPSGHSHGVPAPHRAPQDSPLPEPPEVSDDDEEGGDANRTQPQLQQGAGAVLRCVALPRPADVLPRRRRGGPQPGARGAPARSKTSYSQVMPFEQPDGRTRTPPGAAGRRPRTAGAGLRPGGRETWDDASAATTATDSTGGGVPTDFLCTVMERASRLQGPELRRRALRLLDGLLDEHAPPVDIAPSSAAGRAAAGGLRHMDPAAVRPNGRGPAEKEDAPSSRRSSGLATAGAARPFLYVDDSDGFSPNRQAAAAQRPAFRPASPPLPAARGSPAAGAAACRGSPTSARPGGSPVPAAVSSHRGEVFRGRPVSPAAGGAHRDGDGHCAPPAAPHGDGRRGMLPSPAAGSSRGGPRRGMLPSPAAESARRGPSDTVADYYGSAPAGVRYTPGMSPAATASSAASSHYNMGMLATAVRQAEHVIKDTFPGWRGMGRDGVLSERVRDLTLRYDGREVVQVRSQLMRELTALIRSVAAKETGQ